MAKQPAQPGEAELREEVRALRLKVRRQMLRDLLHGAPVAGETLDEINEYYGYQLRPGAFNVLMIQLHPRSESAPPVDGALLGWVDRDARMCLADGPFLELETLAEDSCLYCLLNFDQPVGSQGAGQVHHAVDRLYHHMDISRRYRPYYFAMGDGLPVRDIRELGSSFLSTRNAVEEYGVNLQVNRLHDSAQQMFAQTQIMNVLTTARRATFSHYLETLQEDRLRQWIDDVFRECRGYLGQFPTIVYQLPYRVLDLCLETAGNAVADDPALQQTLLECHAVVDAHRDYGDQAGVTKEGVTRFCRQYAKSRSRENNYAVLAAKEFMRNHYTRRLTLDEIAGEVHLNAQYFSVLFKRESGVSVVDYLTGLRMEQSKALLRDSGMAINEIARAVGYDDPDYFSRVFRRNNGMSPRQYRNIVKS